MSLPQRNLPRDLWIPWGFLVGALVPAFLLARSATLGQAPSVLTGIILAVERVLVLGAPLLVLPLLGTAQTPARTPARTSEEGVAWRPRLRTAVLLVALLAALILTVGYLDPLARRVGQEAAGPGADPATWVLGQKVVSLATGKEPVGYLLGPGQQVLLRIELHAWVDRLILVFLPFLALLGGRRARWPWWLALPSSLGIAWLAWLGGRRLAHEATYGAGGPLVLEHLAVLAAPLALVAAITVGSRLLTTSSEETVHRVGPPRIRALAWGLAAALAGGLLVPVLVAWVHPLGRYVLLNPPALEIGAPAPDFRAPGFRGPDARLRDFRGQVVVLSFWATWCGPCRHEIPFLGDLQERLGPDGLRVVMVNAQESREAIGYWQDATGLRFPTLLSTPRVLLLYPQMGLPTTFLIDRQGRLRLVHQGFSPEWAEELERRIERLLAEESPDRTSSVLDTYQIPSHAP